MLRKPLLFQRYILREHLGPFLFALSLIVFLFLMNYTLREAYKLFGRGLEAHIILKLYYYQLAPTLALAVPMSVLVATAMAFLRIASDSEITILRSSGVSLLRVLLPVFIASIFVAVGMFHFNNTILPAYNIESSNLRSEIFRVKPTAQLIERTFTNIKDVRLYVKRIDNEFSEKKELKRKRLGEKYVDIPVDHLFEVQIYDYSDLSTSKTFIAKEGFLLLNEQIKKFEFILEDGEIHEVKHDEKDKYQISFFDKTRFYIRANEFVMDEDGNRRSTKSNRQKTDEELQSSIIEENENVFRRLKNNYKDFTTKKIHAEIPKAVKVKLEEINGVEKDSVRKAQFKQHIYKQFQNFIQQELRSLNSIDRLNGYSEKEINDLKGEYHKKFAIPFASIVFILIGAPLGMMTKKGEMGAATSVCLIVFIIYYICLILGEDMSEDGKITPWLAIWSGNIIGFSIGAYFLYLLRKERSIIDLEIFNLLKRSKK